MGKDETGCGIKPDWVRVTTASPARAVRFSTSNRNCNPNNPSPTHNPNGVITSSSALANRFSNSLRVRRREASPCALGKGCVRVRIRDLCILMEPNGPYTP